MKQIFTLLSKSFFNPLLLFAILFFSHSKLNAQCDVPDIDFQPSCPYVTQFVEVARVDIGGGDCDYTFEISWERGTANNASLQWAFCVNGNSQGNVDDDCDLPDIDQATTGNSGTETVIMTAPCVAQIVLIWQGRTNASCGGNICNAGELTEGPLPVELVGFTGTPKDNMVELKWSTQSEENNRHFEIQRSEDGRTFENIGITEGNGSSVQINHYSFMDKQALPFAYYRLKQVDYDGAFDFSDIISVKRSATESKLTVYPSQAFNEVTIRMESLDSRKSYLKVANISGHVMFEETYFGANKNENLSLDIKDYPPGIYFVSLTDKIETVTTKFVVAKD